jgi:hypothetical protein
MTSTFRGETEHVRHTARTYLDRVKQVEQSLEEALAAGVQTHHRQSSAQHGDSAVADDEDEGWQSDPDAPSSSSGAPLAARHGSPSSPRTAGHAHTHSHAHKKKPGMFAGRGRRRNSIRRALHAPQLPDEEERGRETRAAALARIESIHSHSRNQSPARSVRWADGTGEPRTLREAASPPVSEPTSPTTDDSPGDSPRHIHFVEGSRR